MKRIYSTLNPQMTKNLSKCCKAETKLGGMPDFDDGEVCTVYNVCLKCKNPCDIRYTEEELKQCIRASNKEQKEVVNRFSFKNKVKATDDSTPLTLARHPRNTLLGATLQLESMFPDMDKKEINRVAPFLASSYDDFFRDKMKQQKEVVDRDWRGRLKEWEETQYGTEKPRQKLENLVESIIENIEIEHSKEMDEAYRAGLKEGIKKHLKL